jgi:peptidoglycan/xylan/chitin deacetylase (PgdA/CDA1 family)
VKKLSYSKLRYAAKEVAAQAFWRIPARFGVAHTLGPSYSLRSVVFHNISSADSPFTEGINVNTTLEEFEVALTFLRKHYTPVRLDDVLGDPEGRKLPPRAVLVTFDDAYASVAEFAAPLCRKFGVPAIFFVNAAFVDNQRLAPDNLVCYVASRLGMKAINAAAHQVRNTVPSAHSVAEIFGVFLPSLTLAERETFFEVLKEIAAINEAHLAEEAGLYLTSAQLRALSSFDFEIGNHTFSHVHCRTLSKSEFEQEIETNKAQLEAVSGTTVRSFSLPYGSSKDLTDNVRVYLEQSGHEAVFLSESVANNRGAERYHLDRVNPRAESEGTFFFDLEVLPRLRVMRNRLLRRPTPASHPAIMPLVS